MKLFDQLGVEYVVEDATDENTIAALKELKFLSAPVVCAGESNDDMWAGFQPDRIKALAERMKGK